MGNVHPTSGLTGDPEKAPPILYRVCSFSDVNRGLGTAVPGHSISGGTVYRRSRPEPSDPSGNSLS